MTSQCKWPIGPLQLLQLAIHVVQNRRAGEQKSHWDKTDKENYYLKSCMSFVCLYFIVLLKRARVPLNDIVNFYCATIRPVLEYCAPVFHYALPAYLNEDIERIHKRALSIISPAMSYRECLDSLGLPTLYDRRNGLCRQLFDSIAINPGHMLYHLLHQENNKAII